MSEPAAGTDAFAVAPYTASEVRFHLLGALLNAAVVLSGAVWLGSRWSSSPPAWPGVALSALAALYLADLVSGLLHWAFDTWFDEEIGFLRRMVLQVREHHVYPQRIFCISFWHDAGTLSWIGLVLVGPLVLWAMVTGAGLAASYAVCTAVLFDLMLVTMLEFHKCGHRPNNPRWVRLLQKSGLLLSVRHHMRHHAGNHDLNYCLINGWADRTLGRLGLFRALEWGVARASGARPQRNDHDWLRRFGLPVIGRRRGRRPAA
ncbi:MAG TPA: fatty acid desaturase CarF family protein [Thermoanaerobaculia bacterium]|nr:fatty acid desaturase CarF family protein [Thermoanaerobaculia bacterium]